MDTNGRVWEEREMRLGRLLVRAAWNAWFVGVDRIDGLQEDGKLVAASFFLAVAPYRGNKVTTLTLKGL